MPVDGITRRRMAGLLAACGVANRVRGTGPLLALNHFKLRVSDLDRSVAFYYSLFGGPMAEERGGSYLTPPDMKSIFLKIGSGKTYLILSPPDPKVPAGFDHLAIDRGGMAVVTQNRIPLAFPGEAYVRDPDGHLLEFVTSGFWESPLPKQSPPLPPDVTNRPPVFEPLTIRRITLRVADLHRSAEFYRLFGTELGGAASKDRQSFDFNGTVLEVVSAGSRPGLDSFTVAKRPGGVRSARWASPPTGNRAAASVSGIGTGTG